MIIIGCCSLCCFNACVYKSPIVHMHGLVSDPWGLPVSVAIIFVVTG